MINFPNNDTIFALATPKGKSGVAVVRISGNRSFNVIKTICQVELLEERKTFVTNLYVPGTNEIIDKALVVFFKNPRSFTGEDVVEFHIHGSIAVIKLLLSTLAKLEGLRLALPGEFSQRAFMNGKMDLTSAEGLADLIEAETIMQQKQAIRQMSGELGELYGGWRESIIEILAYIEAYLDFPDENIPQAVLQEVENSISSLKNAIKNHLNDNMRGQRLREGVFVAIIGAPNVGKSSLLNYIARKDVAIVSDIAGTTRDVIEINLDLDGIPITIADTAGIRETLDLIENEGVKRAKDKALKADFNIIMLDSSNFDKESLKLIDQNSIIVLNKIDLYDDSIISNFHPELDNLPNQIVPISIKENIDLDRLLAIIKEKAAEFVSLGNEPSITRIRYRQLLEEALANLDYFTFDKELELAAEDLRLAARAIGHITGAIDVDEILDKIFSSFCIGK